jgi:hypothetical protein
MPLPNLTPENRCTARARRTGERCLRLAAWGCCTCQFHGARRPESIKRGKDNPRYVHGQRTQEAMQAYSQASHKLRELETKAFAAGFMTGPRTRGRPPKPA